MMFPVEDASPMPLPRPKPPKHAADLYRGGPQLQALRRANRKRNRAARKARALNRRRS